MVSLSGSIHRPSCLGDLRHDHSRFYHPPLHPNISHPILPPRVLLNTCHKSRLLPKCNPCQLSDLSTGIVSMGSLNPGRYVRVFEVSRPFHWDVQSFPRCLCGGDAYANSLGPKNEHEQEDRSDWHLRDGNRVRRPLLKYLIPDSQAFHNI